MKVSTTKNEYNNTWRSFFFLSKEEIATFMEGVEPRGLRVTIRGSGKNGFEIRRDIAGGIAFTQTGNCGNIGFSPLRYGIQQIKNRAVPLQANILSGRIETATLPPEFLMPSDGRREIVRQAALAENPFADVEAAHSLLKEAHDQLQEAITSISGKGYIVQTMWNDGLPLLDISKTVGKKIGG